MSDQRPPLATPENAPWGLYDTVDHCWLGTMKSPHIFPSAEWPLAEAFLVARAAESIVNERFRTVVRFRLCEFREPHLRFKDEVTPKLSFQEALTRLESQATRPEDDA